MRILVTGGNGMVATAVKEVFTDDELICTDIDTLDVRYFNSGLAYENIDLIIHLAAKTDLEECEKDPLDAFMTNYVGTQNMTLLAMKWRVPIIYMSTAGVFDGKKPFYAYNDEPSPINYYGRSKWYGELAVRQYAKHWIVRASWMMGGGPGIDKKFVNKLITKIKNGEKEIKVCDDVWGSPTYTVDLAKSLENMIAKNYPFGTYHCSGRGMCSRFDVAQKIVSILNYDVKIIPVLSEDVKGEFPCLRSKNEVLVNRRMPLMRNWEVSLEEYINAYYRH